MILCIFFRRLKNNLEQFFAENDKKDEIMKLLERRQKTGKMVNMFFNKVNTEFKKKNFT